MSLSPSGSDLLASSSVLLPVVDSTQVGEARRRATSLTRQLGFDETRCGQVAIAVTEAATNLIKHAQQGELLYSECQRGGSAGFELLSLDRGPGMADPDRCLRDGYSTAGSPGSGLGAIQRLAQSFEIHSMPQVGTGLLARFWPTPSEADADSDPLALQVGVIHLPKPGEEVCGDLWAVERQAERTLILVVDGLGHGPLAAAAAHEAARVLRHNSEQAVVEIVHRMHAALRSTRGAALALSEIRPQEGILNYVGVGNISGTIFCDGASRSTISHNGTVGHEARKIQQFTYEFPRGALLVMNSDGLSTQWRLEQYPGLALRDPSLIAGVLYRDFKRGRDDVTVLVARYAE